VKPCITRRRKDAPRNGTKPDFTCLAVAETSEVEPVNGTQIGAIVGAINGLGWSSACAAALASKFRPAVVLVSVMITALEVWLITHVQSSMNAIVFDGQLYGWVVLFEIISIVASILVLKRLHRADLIPSAIGLVVAVHFVGLWAAIHARVYVGLSLALTATAMVSLLIPEAASETVPRGRLVFLGSANALALWVSAMLPLLR